MHETCSTLPGRVETGCGRCLLLCTVNRGQFYSQFETQLALCHAEAQYAAFAIDKCR